MCLMQSQPMLHNEFGLTAMTATEGNRKTSLLRRYQFPCGHLI